MCAIMLPLGRRGRARKVRSYISRVGKCGSAAHPSYLGNAPKEAVQNSARALESLGID